MGVKIGRFLERATVFFCQRFGIQEGAAADLTTKSQSQPHLFQLMLWRGLSLAPEDRKYRDDVEKEKEKEKEHEQWYGNYAELPRRVRVGDREVRFERFETCVLEMAQLEGGALPEAGNTRSASYEVCKTHSNPFETRSDYNTPPEASNTYDNPLKIRNHNTPPEANNNQKNPFEIRSNPFETRLDNRNPSKKRSHIRNPFETRSYAHNPFKTRSNNPFETQSNHSTPSEANNAHNTPDHTASSETGNTPFENNNTPSKASDTPPKSSNTPPNGHHDQDIFSHASQVTISGGQFNNVHGDQANSVGFYAFGLPQLQPRFRTDKSPMLTLMSLEDIRTFLCGQLSLLASSLDLPVFELLLLLAYHSFEPQLIELISYLYVVTAYTVHLVTA
ncbi:hypothetical protein Moror_9611 [Moniliophthora roreri MCA 2997]|uniref:Uncharacterized protein n=1 Tax=Moniliophthora roreri (strain MCA 2997) TaxID=1381753 RepID=V2WNS3_MONRO|nr:hypothetical protein Moror_9611 [Moniliophthora roreri MCA 2997]